MCGPAEKVKKPAPAKKGFTPESVTNLMWYTEVVKGPKTTKMFLTNGSPNGDILESQLGCCSVFTSKRANLTVEWCQGNMRYKVGAAKFQFVNKFGANISQMEFGMKSCLNLDEVKKLQKQNAKMQKAPLQVHVYTGGVVISEPDQTTTLTADGQIVSKTDETVNSQDVNSNSNNNSKDTNDATSNSNEPNASPNASPLTAEQKQNIIDKIANKGLLTDPTKKEDIKKDEIKKDKDEQTDEDKTDEEKKADDKAKENKENKDNKENDDKSSDPSSDGPSNDGNSNGKNDGPAMPGGAPPKRGDKSPIKKPVSPADKALNAISQSGGLAVSAAATEEPEETKEEKAQVQKAANTKRSKPAPIIPEEPMAEEQKPADKIIRDLG